jgi:predicted RNA-binding Zn ribbon-like protein
VKIDSYEDAGVLAAVELVNELGVERESGAPMPTSEAVSAIARIVAVDPPSVAALDEGHVPAFVALARQLRDVFDDLHRGDLDIAASRLNELLARYPAHPHLAKERGRWRLHHHPVDTALVPMWTSICAEGMARLIGTGHGDRLGTCARVGCARVFLDLSKNASRRFCSTACQNRVKVAAFRQRRAS